MNNPMELTDAETAAVSGGLLNNIFVNLGTIGSSSNTSSFNTNSLDRSNSNNSWLSFNNLFERQQHLISWAPRRVLPGVFFFFHAFAQMNWARPGGEHLTSPAAGLLAERRSCKL